MGTAVNSTMRYTWFCSALSCATALAATLSASPVVGQIVPPRVYTMSPGGVNVSDASFPDPQSDLTIGPISLTRFNVPPAPAPSGRYFGSYSSHNFDIAISSKRYPPRSPVPAYDKFVVHLGSGAGGVWRRFTNDPTLWEMDGQASGATLQAVNGDWVYTANDGTIYSLRGTSRSTTSILFPDGREQLLHYSNDRLKLVTDSSGYALVFDNDISGRVTAACGFNLAHTYVSITTTCAGADLKVLYAYTSATDGRLASVTNAVGQTTIYTYGLAGTLADGTVYDEAACIKPPGYTACRVTNYNYVALGKRQVLRQIMADGATWKYFPGSSGLDLSEPITDGGNEGSMIDPAGKTYNFVFTGSSPYAMTDPNGTVTQYRFTGGGGFDSDTPTSTEGGFLNYVTEPEGGIYQVSYGIRNVTTRQTHKSKPGSGLPDIVYENGYSCPAPSYPIIQCTRPIWTRDARGNQTDYTYMSNGLLLTEMQPAPSTDGPRLLKVHTYVQKYAWVRNSGGGLTQAASPIWVPQTETVCQTTAGNSTPVCDVAAVQTTTAYEYGPDGTANNLRVRGKVVSSGGTSLRTCYGYDWRGNKIWETSPRAGLSVCQ